MTKYNKYKGGSAEAVRMHRNLMNAKQVSSNQSGGESSPASVPAPSPTTVTLQGNNNAIPVYAPSGSSDQTTIMQIKNTQNQGNENNKTDTPGPGLKGGKRKRTKRKQTKKKTKGTKKRKTIQNKKSRKSRSRK
jgi:hypothetical protein